MAETIAQFTKSTTEEIRVSISEFRGRHLIDIRTFYLDQDEEYKPTKKGVSIAVELYPEFKEAMRKLEEALKEEGLLA